jgi:hypothetical protein
VGTTTGVVSRPTQTMVYPVPTTGAFTVVSQEGHNLQRVAVYSLTGQEIDVVMTSGTTARRKKRVLPAADRLRGWVTGSPKDH